MMPMTAAAHGSTKAQGAVMATRPASMPLAIMPGSGLPVRIQIQNMPIDGAERTGDGGVGRDDGELDVAGGEGRGGVEAEPAEQQDERAQHGHRDVVAGQRTRLAVLAELADARTEHDGAGQRGDAADGVHDARAGEVDVAVAPAHRVAQLGQPAAAPGPGAEQRVVDGPAEQAPDHEALPLPPLGHGAGRDGGHGVHERHHVEEEAGGGARTARAWPVEPRPGPAALPEEDPVPAADQRATRRLAEAVVVAAAAT